jgi:class 3 adenylate cyclase
MKKEDVIARVETAIRESTIREQERIQDAPLEDYQPKDWHLADVALPTAIKSKDHEATQSLPPTREERVLVADDNDDMRSLIASVLRVEGYEVLSARNGQEALAIAEQERVDVVISDWMMPKMSGPELLAALQKDPKLAGIPTILLTAKGDDVSKMLAAREGVSAYLSKPFDEIELKCTVANLLKLKQGERKIAALNRDLTENVLKRFLPPQLVNEIAGGHKEFLDGVHTHQVTIMFADLCRFTENSSQLGPSKIAKVLNEYLDVMTDIIFAYRGTIDKFIGDAIMVIFGAPEKMEAVEQARKACSCAMEMQFALHQLCEKWARDGMPEFKMRIGLHSGPATVGMFGGSKRSDYTVIGPTVNLASRVEGVAGEGEIFITSIVRDYLDDDSWEMAGNFQLKGIPGQTPLFRLKAARQKAA